MTTEQKYLCPSKHGHGDYVVTLNHAGGAKNCTCPGWKYRHECTHATDVEAKPSAFKKYKDGVESKQSVVVGATGAFRNLMKCGTVELDKLDWSRRWHAQLKYDGHRLEVSVVSGKSVTAWARSGKERPLPKHLVKQLIQFTTAVYDGELVVPGGRSYNVTELKKAGDRTFVIFDVLEIIGRDCINESYDRRREVLTAVFAAVPKTPHVLLTDSVPVANAKAAQALFAQVKKAGGEGLILKDCASKYEIGERTKTWVKMKRVSSAVLRCYAIEHGTRPHSKLKLEDKDGNRTSVKIRNDKWLAEVQKNPKKHLGRMVRIEFQERTPKGGYRGPVRMDRWEDE